ncbi:PREDICTED: ubiquitin-conjugating enzyme E2 23 isoform [Prunus dulcis]|uniref:PREDICTED: ubiquitin-conjugating enzyme E2 23 isoform n=1 Tax=Prunus dulcis TaxID=3755 RepID=A0A5E4EPA3_PRUDU|nr:PREDICTED: ubiquitin-conjugating enzyme E2 23 isoform [Prunus dulcis]
MEGRIQNYETTLMPLPAPPSALYSPRQITIPWEPLSVRKITKLFLFSVRRLLLLPLSDSSLFFSAQTLRFSLAGQ